MRTRLVAAAAALALAATFGLTTAAQAATTGTLNPATVSGTSISWTCDVNPGGATIDVTGASWLNADGSSFAETAKQRITGSATQRLTFTRAGSGEQTYGYRCKWYATTGALLGKTANFLLATTDTTAPDTTITSGPAANTTDHDADFAFTATEAASYECSVDAGPYAPCTSPEGYAGLDVGAHTFAVRATDNAGNVDATPATYAWQVRYRTVSALDASPAPAGDWDQDYLDKADRFTDHDNITEATDLLNMPRVFFPPSSTMSWSAVQTNAFHAGEVPVISKKGTYTVAEVTNFVNNMPASLPKMVLIYNHEIKAADMSASTFLARNAEWRSIIDASPNADRIVFVVNLMQYQIDHNAMNWRAYLGSNPGAIWDGITTDVYNEPWLGGADGYETFGDVLGTWDEMVTEIETTLCTTCFTAVVEYGANLEAGGAAGQLALYEDMWAWANDHNQAWVGWWADDNTTPVWHDEANLTNPIQEMVRDTMLATRGQAAELN
jgi:hypothetical protein